MAVVTGSTCTAGRQAASEGGMFTSEQRGAPTGLAVLTGGGDAGGMNGAVLAVVRPALYRGMQPYAVHEDRAGWSKAPA